MASLYDLYDQLANRSGMFSPLALSSERKMARELAPSVARSAATLGAAGMQANADVLREALRGRAGLEATRLGEAGATKRQGMEGETRLARQSLINQGNVLVQKLINSGLLSRENIAQRGATTRTKLQEAGATGRLDLANKEAERAQRMGHRFNKDILTDMQLYQQSNRQAAVASPMSIIEDNLSQPTLQSGAAVPSAEIEQPENKKRKSIFEVFQTAKNPQDLDAMMNDYWNMTSGRF